MVPQSWLISAALCVMVVLEEGMCDVSYMQIFKSTDSFPASESFSVIILLRFFSLLLYVKRTSHYIYYYDHSVSVCLNPNLLLMHT